MLYMIYMHLGILDWFDHAATTYEAQFGGLM